MTKLEINSADGMQKLGASLAKTAQPYDLLLLMVIWVQARQP